MTGARSASGAIGVELVAYSTVAVGMRVSLHPPHRSHRAAFPQRAPVSGDDALAFEAWAAHPVPARAGWHRTTCISRRSVRCGPVAPAPLDRAPSLHPLRGQQSWPCSRGSQVLRTRPTSHARSSPACALASFPARPGTAKRLRAGVRYPRFQRIPFVRDGVLDLGRASEPRIAVPHMLPSTGSENLGLCDIEYFAAQ